ncbi:glycosyltransferase family 2 protein [Roseovarius arcticus]|uniref:glycosyltransferase family 2 protein n=1 Tax=Roseovarius arcticus TaxID=2547404 RepID=UPI001110AF2C|nr:glycosyltransferase family 2 protein [Roseovarius arcticus]
MRQSKPSERVTIVSVAYNSAAVLDTMLASVPVETPVVIFDNASQDRPQLRDVIAIRGGNTHLVESDENLGFGAGCNGGAARAETEFLLFLNPDTALFPDTLERLIFAADQHPAATAFNPRILDDDGTAILKRRSDLVPRRAWLPRSALTHDTVVPILSGAALFVRRDDFDAVGGFDPRIFLFFEDDDLSVRLSETRGNLMYVHDARVRHVGGASSEWSPKGERLKNWHWGFSQIYTMRKHGLRMGCLRAFLKTGLRALSPVTILSTRRRTKYAARLSGMIRSLRRGGDYNG